LQKDYAKSGLKISVANDGSVYTLQSADAVNPGFSEYNYFSGISNAFLFAQYKKLSYCNGNHSCIVDCNFYRERSYWGISST
jgi:hypothetical protein